MFWQKKSIESEESVKIRARITGLELEISQLKSKYLELDKKIDVFESNLRTFRRKALQIAKEEAKNEQEETENLNNPQFIPL